MTSTPLDYEALASKHMCNGLATEHAQKMAAKGGEHAAKVLEAYCYNVYELACCTELPTGRRLEAYENVEENAVKAQACAVGGPVKSAGTACWEGFFTIVLAVHAVVREHDLGNYYGNVLGNWLGYKEKFEGDVQRVHKRTSRLICELGKMWASDNSDVVAEARARVLRQLELLPMPCGIDNPAKLARKERCQRMREEARANSNRL